ncbi:hypothetical protein INH39_25370 [Massilia violaceinigra]|uniref:Uncharacterized protein n=1 Tax=Massilia violaceinigra TaxID=2045208 RepID=A0ABY4A1Y8_9BURK|nr:hypothetical protein [Massilia violaceinigra]UOD28741.1 hypothetical protein INH39_25370 [Massilia violaceinigra]
MSNGSVRRPDEIPDDAWERIFEAPIDPETPVLVDPDEDDDEVEIPGAPLEPWANNERNGK